MEFINKFKHGDDKDEGEHKPTYADSSVQTGQTQTLSHDAPKHDAEEPSRDFLGKLIAGSGHHHESTSGGGDEDRNSFLDRLGRKEDREKKQLELEKRELELKYELEKVQKEKKDNEGFFDKLKDKFDGGDPDKEKTQNELKEEDKPSFFDKITGKEEREKKAAELDRKEAEIRAEMEKIKDEKKKNQDLLDRLKSALERDEDDAESKTKKADKPSFLDKITGKAEEDHHKKVFLTEENEDFLDKTIDGIQEHILHKGDQSKESAFEQLQDQMLASAIRKQLHLKEKKDKE